MRTLVWEVGCVCSGGSGRLCDGNLGSCRVESPRSFGRVSGEDNGAVMLVDSGYQLTVSGLAQGATELHASSKSRNKRLRHR